MSCDYDVIIAGAGCSGVISALVLNQAGYKVSMVDELKKESFKAGESIPGAIRRLVSRVGFESIEELLSEVDYKSCVANLSSWGSEEWSYTDAISNPEGGGWHLNRIEFDNTLRRKAIDRGVTLEIGKVKHINSIGEGYEVDIVNSDNSSKKLTSNWLIDATGRSSSIGLKLNKKRLSSDDQMAVVCWVSTDSKDQDCTTRIKSVASGWFYSALLPNNARVISFFGEPKDVISFSKNPKSLLNDFNNSNTLPFNFSIENLISEIKVYKAGITKLSSIGGDNWIAVGDAVLSLDPLSSQGIFFAFYSGVRGAETIIKSMQDKRQIDFAMQNYRRVIDNVYQANQSSRNYYYSSETRFYNHSYWINRRNILK